MDIGSRVVSQWVEETPALTWSRLLFSFEGRIDRRTYIWRYAVAHTLFIFSGIGLTVPIVLLRGNTIAVQSLTLLDIAVGAYFLAFIALFIWITAAGITKRMHDRGLHGAFGFLCLIGYVRFFFQPETVSFLVVVIVASIPSIWFFIQCCCLSGKAGPNSYGQRPMRFGIQDPLQKQMRRSWVSFLLDISYIPLLLLIILVFRSMVYEPFNIPSSSMAPTLLVGDYIAVSKYSYGYNRFSLPISFGVPVDRFFKSMPAPGDVVVFRLPADPTISYVKRVVGLPRDHVQMVNGVLLLNGTPVKFEQTGSYHDDNGATSAEVPLYTETLPNGRSYTVAKINRPGEGILDNTVEWTVPDDCVFVLGDNRDNSQDSRVVTRVGFIPLANLVGRADARFFSLRGFDQKRGPQIRLSRILTEIQ